MVEQATPVQRGSAAASFVAVGALAPSAAAAPSTGGEPHDDNRRRARARRLLSRPGRRRRCSCTAPTSPTTGSRRRTATSSSSTTSSGVRRARQEFDAFVDLMREYGIDVLLFHDLLDDDAQDPEARAWLLSRRLRPEEVTEMFSDELTAGTTQMPAGELWISETLRRGRNPGGRGHLGRRDLAREARLPAVRPDGCRRRSRHPRPRRRTRRARCTGLVPPGVALVWMAALSAITVVTADREGSAGLATMAIALAFSRRSWSPANRYQHLVLFADD